MPSLPNVSLPSGLWRRVRSLYDQSPRLSTPRTWRLSSVGKRPRPSAVSTPSRLSVANRASLLASPATLRMETSSQLSDYELLSVLGRGTFGVVRLARHKASGRAVAIKMLDRREVVAMKQEVNILREQTVHLQLRHAFISQIYTTFQDLDAVYFVLEYCPGGELYSLVYQEEEDEMLDEIAENDHEDDPEHEATEDESSDEDDARAKHQRKRTTSGDNACAKRALLDAQFGGLREPHVAFYAACVLSALGYLHDAQNVLYRDLKLENLVIGPDGYPKLVDFGLSKPDAVTNPRDANTTMCGSAEYMAPEVVRRQSYDHRADLWSLGVLLFELFFGATPFYHPNAREQSRRILEDQVEFPEGFEAQSPHACALIRALLAKNPLDRPVSCASLREHAFFTQFFPTVKSWKQLEAKQMRAPFVPQLSGPFDTSLFANAYDDEDDESFVGY